MTDLLTMAFVGFFAIIIGMQLIPACIMFIGMIKGLFSNEVTKEVIEK